MNKWLEKYRAWRRNKKYVNGTYFKISSDITIKNPEIILPIEILKGSYAGIVYGIKNFKFLDEGIGKATFEYEIITNYGPYDSDLDFTNDKKFDRMVSDILIVVLEQAIGNYTDLKKEILKDEEVRDNYIEEPVEERVIRKKDSSVSKKGVSSKSGRKSTVRGSRKTRTKVQPTSND